MKTLLRLVVFACLFSSASAQDIKGKWYGMVTQIPGGYSTFFDLEFDIKQDPGITGVSYSYKHPNLYEKLQFTGKVRGDSIYLREDSAKIMQEILPEDWVLCVKNFTVAYRKVGAREFLQGTWDGKMKGDRTRDCLPGSVILSRSKEDIKYFVDSIHSPIPASGFEPVPSFTKTFANTNISKVTEIEVKHLDLELRLRDYLEVDNDTITVYLNRKILAPNIWISKKAVSIKFKMNPTVPLNELLLYAVNLGRIPPNTSEMYLIDGTRSYRIMIESDKQKTAAVYLRYKP
ncbi:hypothetical protein [Hufsiella ginkgonis]|uniref:Lipocalin-like domain-containing protein n=1 Tax=Hufsiella ginkgonis TaxID=2695274 RepID=A0A7K1Y1P5_9SPHI|nr:hypothetical protein [Hufsiella ginkgonis]MXV17165.1 hypothetical protein [Hufsiella ginkgonis]